MNGNYYCRLLQLISYKSEVNKNNGSFVTIAVEVRTSQTLPKPGKDSYNDCSAYRTVSTTHWYVWKATRESGIGYNNLWIGTSRIRRGPVCYLTHRSSAQAVLSLVETIQRNALSHSITGVLFFDFADAFGSVNGTMLIYKLVNNFGISGRLLLYLVNFFQDVRLGSM